MHKAFEGVEGVEFAGFKRLLLDWSNRADEPDSPVDEEEHPDLPMISSANVSEVRQDQEAIFVHVLIAHTLHNFNQVGFRETQTKQHRPSFVRGNSRTFLSTDEDDYRNVDGTHAFPMLVMLEQSDLTYSCGNASTRAVNQEISLLEERLAEVRAKERAHQAECDELRYEMDQHMTIISNLKEKVAAQDDAIQRLKDELHEKQLEVDLSSQELLLEKLETTRLRAHIQHLQR